MRHGRCAVCNAMVEILAFHGHMLAMEHVRLLRTGGQRCRGTRKSVKEELEPTLRKRREKAEGCEDIV